MARVRYCATERNANWRRSTAVMAFRQPEGLYGEAGASGRPAGRRHRGPDEPCASSGGRGSGPGSGESQHIITRDVFFA